MLASWRGTRFEVTQVLREVCLCSIYFHFRSVTTFCQVVDNVLKEPGVSDQVLYTRAKVQTYIFSIVSRIYILSLNVLQGLLLIGAIFKSAKPDESDEERRELERYFLSL